MRHVNFHHQTAQKAFTLVEMLVIAPIMLLTVAAFIGIIISLTGQTLVAQAENTLAYTVQDTLNRMEQDIQVSGAFLASNTTPASSPQGFDNNTQAFNNISTANGGMLILNAFATTGTGISRAVIPIANLPNACSAANVDQNQVLTYTIVYFIKDNALWRRAIMPSNYKTKGCSAPIERPTCAAAFVTSNGFCATPDEKLLENASSIALDIKYYTTPQSTSPLTTASNPSSTTSTRQTSLNTATSAQVTIHITQRVAGQDSTFDGTLRANRLGSLVTSVTPIP
jgi:Tfp pilus assembly protein PilE